MNDPSPPPGQAPSVTELLPHLHGEGPMASYAQLAVWRHFERRLVCAADQALRPPRRANGTKRTVANSAYRRFLQEGADGKLAAHPDEDHPVDDNPSNEGGRNDV